MDIEILNKQDAGEPTRPYDFSIDQTSIIGKAFVLNKETGEKDFESYFKNNLLPQNSGVNMHLRFMITAYKNFGRIRLFCGDITQKCYGEILKQWLEDEITKLRITCSIY